MTTKLRRGVAALATALACLLLTATPASAAVHSVDITGGTLTLVNAANTATLNVPWAGSAGTGCGHSMDIEHLPGPDTYEVLSYSSRSRHNFLLGAYIVVVTRTGSIAGGYALPNLNSSTLSLKIEFFNVANANPATDCATAGAVRCTYTVTLQLSGNSTGWASSDTGALGYAQANLAGGIPCAVPHTAWANGTVAAGGFTFHLTA
jgi:hypothetical protein